MKRVHFDRSPPTVIYTEKYSKEEIIGSPGKDGYIFYALQRQQFLPIYHYCCQANLHIPNPKISQEEDIDIELEKFIPLNQNGYMRLKRILRY
jgi:hypothetical protein